jgi:hypothetical protein
MEKRREQAKLSASKRWTSNANAMPTHSESNANVMHSIVEESIVKKRIVKNSKVEKNKEVSIDLLIVSSDDFLPAWRRWIEYKAKINKPYKTQEGMQTQYEHLIELSNNDSTTAMCIVAQSIGREWEGLFPLKVSDKTNSIQGEDPIAKNLREVKEIRAIRKSAEASEKSLNDGNKQ